MDKKEQIDRLNEAVEKEAVNERKRLKINLDEALKEYSRDEFEIVFEGEVFTLPAQAPAWLPIFFKHYMDDDGTIPDKKNLEIIERLLGKKFASAIMDSDSNMTFEFVNKHVIIPVFKQWGFGDVEDATGKG